ncbi:carboxypeptidase-like regulatory domain-containing protein [Aquimarina macrocephali]|uniref:carboxypeptidase-like regulatory domain-containing protein n=1 Tax=Aquimarina macrocephali TaxID=666563 RepID=UPI000466BDDA|nr:carboxypeptidase-like regulatory domain-containing protein [Aquimarina macrocephali]
MVKKISLIKVIILFCFLPEINAQDLSGVGELFCRVLSADSEFPVYYATIKISGTNRGLIADEEGEFRLPNNIGVSEKIKLSSIGYKTKEITVKELKTDQINIIYLESNIEDLDAVTVVSSSKPKKQERRFSAKQIVLKALSSISLNYPEKPFSYIGYYRDYQQPIDDSYEYISKRHKNSTQYINLNESIIEVFDAGFGTDYLTNNQNQTVVYSYNQNKTFAQDDMLAVPYDNKNKKYLKNVFIPPFGGNELNVLNITNAIRNHDRTSFSFIDVLDDNFIKNHFFSIEGISYLDDIPIYEINFVTEERASGKSHSGKGKIFISKENFAIHKLHYELYGQNKKAPLYEATIEYVPIKGKMYLNYITFNNKFQAGSDHYFKIMATDLDTDDMFFDVYFNNVLDKNTLYPIHKKFKVVYTYKEEKVKIKQVIALDDRIRVVLDKEQLFSLPNFKLDNLSEVLRLKIRNVKDTDGKVLHEIPKVILNQYREVFIQEVFLGKKLEGDMRLMNKNSPLSEAAINPFKDKDKYWVNTPLKRIKKH